MDREITITITDEEARLIEERIAAGGYSSAADYVHAAVDNFVLFENGPQLSEDLLRRLINEADDDPRPDVDAEEAFDRVYRYIDELATKLDAKS